MITKSIIISQMPEYTQKGEGIVRGVLSLKGDKTFVANLRVFNISEMALPIILAIKWGNQREIIKNITTPQDYTFPFTQFEPNSEINVVLATENFGELRGIACGGLLKSADINELFEDEDIDDIIEKEIVKQNMTEVLSSATDKIVQKIANNRSFYAMIEEQLNLLFDKFPHCLELENLVQNTEWIKVNYSQNENSHYVLGKLYDDNVVSYLCYGLPVPAHSVAPPNSLVEYCQWLPLNLNEPDGSGYWVMYQSAKDGQNIKL